MLLPFSLGHRTGVSSLARTHVVVVPCHVLLITVLYTVRLVFVVVDASQQAPIATVSRRRVLISVIAMHVWRQTMS